MRKLLIALIAATAALLAPSLAPAQTIARSQTGAVGSLVTCTDPSGNTGKCVLQGMVPYDSSGTEKGTASNPLYTTAASGSTNQVQGTVASAATDSGNPVKTGCVYNSSLPTFTTGQRADCQANSHGSLEAILLDSNGNAIRSASPGNSTTISASYLDTFALGALYNGASADMAFTCANSAAVNVTAGNTTQIVGLSGSTVIRVCSVALSMSAAGTAGIYTGTGTNCGTGTTALVQDMTLATGTPLALSATAGGSLVRTTAGGALCVKAVTGNVTGVITYAQF